MVNGELHIFMDRSMFFDSDFYGYRNIMEGVLLFEMFGIILATLNRRRHSKKSTQSGMFPLCVLCSFDSDMI